LACALGCDGKWAIHPDQLATINQIFSPTKEEIEQARKVIEVHKSAGENGFGATALDSRMVDNATVRLAQQLWAQADQLNLIED
jgi:citrate lyase beta subunit